MNSKTNSSKDIINKLKRIIYNNTINTNNNMDNTTENPISILRENSISYKNNNNNYYNMNNKPLITNFNLVDDSYIKERNLLRNSLIQKINQKSFNRIKNKERDVNKFSKFLCIFHLKNRPLSWQKSQIYLILQI
jgi:hypothetical protein